MRNTGATQRAGSVRRGELAPQRLRGCRRVGGKGEGRRPPPIPSGLGARGRGPQAPSPVCTRPAAALKNCTIQDRVSPPRKGVGKPAGCLTLFRSGGVYAARSDFSIAKSHLAAEKSFPLSLDLCPSGRGSKGCPSLKASARLRAGTFSDKRLRGPPRSRLTLRVGC